jgi:multicomponent Na+:H+ antiporter subunit E
MDNSYSQRNHLLKVFILIFIFWFLLSGMTNLLMIMLGLFSSFFVVWIINKMDLVDREVSFHNFNISKLIMYFFWLLREIIVSNLKVCLYIITPNKKINPEIIKIKSRQNSEFANVLYANSITLTPGTVTIDVDKNNFTVHTLDTQFKESLEKNIMDEKILSTEQNINRKEKNKND